MHAQKYMPVASAIEQVTGSRPHPSTVCRWTLKRGLKSWMIGGRRMTTISAVQEFIESRTKATTPGYEISKVRAALNKELAS